MKILKILGIAAGVHALALVLLLSSPGCSSSKAQTSDASVAPPTAISDAPTPPPATITVPAQDSVSIRYSPTRPGTAVASALEAPPVSDVTPASTYTVVSGDSLSAVAKRFHLTKAELASANHLRSSTTLRLGQRLIIPSKAVAPREGGEAAPSRTAESVSPPPPAVSGDSVRHVVKPGETLGAIARHYGVKQGDIAVANNITDPKRIRPGQELVIPARGAPAARQARAGAPAPDTAKAPPAGEDLDAGLKPASGEVPTVKVDDSSQQPRNP